jgi:hypothetical protein
MSATSGENSIFGLMGRKLPLGVVGRVQREGAFTSRGSGLAFVVAFRL